MCHFLLGPHFLCQCVKLTGVCPHSDSYGDRFSCLILLVTCQHSAVVFDLSTKFVTLFTLCLIVVIIVQCPVTFINIPVLSLTVFFLFFFAVFSLPCECHSVFKIPVSEKCGRCDIIHLLYYLTPWCRIGALHALNGC